MSKRPGKKVRKEAAEQLALSQPFAAPKATVAPPVATPPLARPTTAHFDPFSATKDKITVDSALPGVASPRETETTESSGRPSLDGSLPDVYAAAAVPLPTDGAETEHDNRIAGRLTGAALSRLWALALVWASTAGHWATSAAPPRGHRPLVLCPVRKPPLSAAAADAAAGNSALLFDKPKRLHPTTWRRWWPALAAATAVLLLASAGTLAAARSQRRYTNDSLTEAMVTANEQVIAVIEELAHKHRAAVHALQREISGLAVRESGLESALAELQAAVSALPHASDLQTDAAQLSAAVADAVKKRIEEYKQQGAFAPANTQPPALRAQVVAHSPLAAGSPLAAKVLAAAPAPLQRLFGLGGAASAPAADAEAAAIRAGAAVSTHAVLHPLASAILNGAEAGTSVQPGRCLPLNGSRGGYVHWRLDKPGVNVTGLYVHYPLHRLRDASSALRRFRATLHCASGAAVCGTGATGATREFAYDAVAGPPLQMFRFEGGGAIADSVTLEILDNHGNPDYTCLYEIRLF